MKNRKKTLEAYFGQSFHFQDDDWNDVPDLADDKEFVTQLPFLNLVNPTGTDMTGPLTVKLGKDIEDDLEEVEKLLQWSLRTRKGKKRILVDPSPSVPVKKSEEVVYDKAVKEQYPEVPPEQVVPGVPGQEPVTFPVTEPQEPKTQKDIGRTYELKKIYTRLVSIDSYLSTHSDPVLLKLKKYVSDALEMFDTLLSNLGTFKEQIDEIIVMYYMFLESVYEILRRHFQKKLEGEEGVKEVEKDVATLDLDKLSSLEKV